MFHREIVDGEPVNYRVAGVWGSGNVVASSEAVIADPSLDSVTVYTMWDGHAIHGPGRPDSELEKYPVFGAVLPAAEFRERYGSLPDCTWWDGEEVAGEDCERACLNRSVVCPQLSLATCLEECPQAGLGYPQVITDCLQTFDQCSAIELCMVDTWRELTEER